MIESAPVVGLLILACSFQDLDPLLGSNIGVPHPASLIARDGKGAMIAWQGVDGQGQVDVRNDSEGTIYLRGLTFRSNGDATWAVLGSKPNQPLENVRVG